MPGKQARRLRAALVALLACSALAPSVAAAAPTPDQAVAELNTWRTQVGESPVSTTTVAAWNTGCQHHNNYEHVNGNTLTHVEASGNPGYTADGEQAGRDSVLSYATAFGSPRPDPALLPGPTWDPAVFHRAALLAPRLGQVGFDSTTVVGGSTYTTFNCLWLQNLDATPPQALDNTRTTPALSLYPSPANGAYHVPTTFPAGTESPDPATETGVPSGSALGWLINVEINGPWAAGNFGFTAFAHDVTATLAPDGSAGSVPVVVSQCGAGGCGGGTSLGAYFEGGFGIFPTQPLAANTTYRVVLTGGTVTDLGAHVDYPIPAGTSWCFSTGATYTPSADCAPPTTAAEEVTNVNASTLPSVGPPPASPTGPGTSPGAPTPPGPGTTPDSGPGTPTPSGATAKTPSTTGSSLTGLKRGRPTLTLKLKTSAGAAKIGAIEIKLPSGLSYATKSKSLLAGLRVTSGRARLAFSAKVRGGVLTIHLRSAAADVEIRLATPALHAGRTAIHNAKRRHPKALSFIVRTTVGGVTKQPKLRLTPR